MEKLKMHSPNLTDENIAKIRELFPGCVTEATDENGRLRYAVDFDQLRQELSDHIVEGPQERYRLDWPGKREALLAANTAISKTLRPGRKESVEFDRCKNLMIEGDNLDALKLLQQSYLGKIKLIYIDPPYNTGGDFVYRDKFAVKAGDFYKNSNQVSELSNHLIANKESNGRFHSEWLSMMYARLRVAKSLLKDDGFIFISIDNNEVQNLKSICTEIFGAENFRNMIVVRRGIKNVQSQFEDIADLASGHEYILCYSRNSSTRMPKLAHISEENQAGKWDTFWRGTDRPTMRYELFGEKPETGQWRWSKDKAYQAKANYEAYISADKSKPSLDDHYLNHLQATNEKLDFVRKNEEGVVQYYVPPRDYKLISDNWMDITIKGNYIGFDTEKHIKLMRRIIDWVGGENEYILDFFAGSGTTAHAVLESNAALSRNNKFILVQLPEPTPEKDYSHLAEMTRERLVKSGTEVQRDFGVDEVETGFRYLKVDSSNMAETFYNPDSTDQKRLLDNVENIKSERNNPEDLLFQVLVDWGVDLTLPIRRETLSDKTIFFVNDEPYDLIACFDYGVTEELVKELAKHEPARVVFRDNGFASDAVKINVEQIFKQLSPATDVKSI